MISEEGIKLKIIDCTEKMNEIVCVDSEETYEEYVTNKAWRNALNWVLEDEE